MILVAGGTGRLGTQVVRLLTARGLKVRILTRDPARARHLQSELVEVVPGDVLDPGAVQRAAEGADTVISAIHGFDGSGKYSPKTVDLLGNSNLIRAAKACGAKHFVMLSIQGARSDHPIELFRMKYQAEQELKASGLSWTILRPTAYMEIWGQLLGVPLLKTEKTRVFGSGNNPINFVSAYDVARFVELAVVDPAMKGETVEIGGPENLTMRQFVRVFEDVTGRRGKISSVPLPMMRVMSVLMRPVNPALARQIQAGVVMDTTDMTFDVSANRRRYPSITPTGLKAVVMRDFAAEAQSSHEPLPSPGTSA